MTNQATATETARVLIVDDETNMRRTLTDILRDEPLISSFILYDFLLTHVFRYRINPLAPSRHAAHGFNGRSALCEFLRPEK